MDLGKTIKHIRIAKKISQKELSESAGITQAYLSLIEGNKKEPSISKLDRISTALGIPVSILIYMSMDETEMDEKQKLIYSQIGKPFKELLKKEFEISDV
jgi:transcriptional regulator with XRE-family HTH domain